MILNILIKWLEAIAVGMIPIGIGLISLFKPKWMCDFFDWQVNKSPTFGKLYRKLGLTPAFASPFFRINLIINGIVFIIFGLLIIQAITS